MNKSRITCTKCHNSYESDSEFDKHAEWCGSIGKNWTWYKGSEEAKSSKMTIYNKSYAQRVVNKLIKSGFEARLVDMGYGNFAVQKII